METESAGASNQLLAGERNREFVLAANQEKRYLGKCPQPLHDVAVLILDTGLRVGEALALRWADVQLTPAMGAKYGYVSVRRKILQCSPECKHHAEGS
jgi:integrase